MQQYSLNSSGGRWILLVTILASGIAFLASIAIPIAVPRIQSAFNAGISGIQWVVNAYLFTLGAMILIGGSLGDRYGRKRVLVAGLAIFSLAALASGLALSIGMLIAMQAVQGIGAALFIPQSLAIINDHFAAAERGRAIGLWASISGAIAAVGPVLCGWVIDVFSWRSVFFVVALFNAAVIGIALLYLPKSDTMKTGKLDWLGIVIILVGLFGLTLGLTSAPQQGWISPVVLASVIGGAAAVAVFAFVEMKRALPLVFLRILKYRLVAVANAATLCLYSGLSAITFFMSLNLQQVQGYSPTLTGLGLLPILLLVTVLTFPTGILADRLGPRLPMTIGSFTVAAGDAILAVTGTQASYFKQFLPGLALLGAGMAVVIPALTKCALGVEPRFSGSASAINNAVARIAGLLAIAFLGTLVVSVFTTHLSASIGQTGLSMPQQQEIISQADKLGNIVIPDTFDADARQATAAAVKGSFVYGFHLVMWLCAGLAFVSGVVSALAIRRREAEERK